MNFQLNKVPGPVLIAFCAFFWSIGGLFIKLVDGHPLAIAGLRSVLAAIVLLVWLKKPKLTFSFPQVAAGIANAVTMLLFVYANKTTTSANAILLQYACPVWTALLAMTILKETVKKTDWITLIFVLAGMILFFVEALTPGAMLGNLAAIASGISFAFFFIFMRMQKDGSPMESFLIAHIITFLVGLPFYFDFAFTPSNLAGLAILGFIQIGAASIFFSIGIKSATAFQTSIITLIEPVFNPVWVLVVTGEIPAVSAIIGGIVIVGAVTISSLGSANDKNQKKQADGLLPVEVTESAGTELL